MRPVRLVAMLAVAAVAVAVATLPATAQDAPAEDRVRVLVLTVDSLHPSEVGPQTPTLQMLKDTGTWYEQSRAVMAAETLPNHVAIGTGTYPGTNGIPGNDGRAAPGDQEAADPDLGRPALLEVASTVDALEATCPDLRTVTVFSKDYVHTIFADDPADSDFPQPTFNIPGSGHAPDTSTVSFILQELASGEAFDYLFANLGDVDRAGHVDPTGTSGVVAGGRQAALEQTDTLLRLVIQALEQQGLWDSTVVVVASDHSMDYSNPADPTTAVDVTGALEADPRTTGAFLVSENGGAALVYLLDPARDDADDVLAAAREVVTGLTGVDEALYREPNAADPGNDLDTVHPAWNLAGTDRAGELFVTVQDGFRVSGSITNGSAPSNPLPGNHGHPTTRHSTMLVTGGWDGLAEPSSVAASDPDAVDTVRFDDTEELPEQSEQVDVAPTTGWLLGLPDPGGDTPQWEGRVLEEAFARQPAPSCVAAAPAPAETETTTAAPAPAGSPSATPAPAATTAPAPTAASPTPAPVTPAPTAGGRLPATGGGLAVAALALAGAALLRRSQRTDGDDDVA